MIEWILDEAMNNAEISLFQEMQTGTCCLMGCVI